jgi:DNA repair protein RadC
MKIPEIESKSIKNWAADDRPREKMMQKGSAALTNAELLAILIRNGTKQKSAIDLAKEIMESVQQDLNLLGRRDVKEFQKIKGIGSAKAIILMAALELGRRRQLEEGLVRKKIVTSQNAAAVFIPLLKDHSHETFCVLYLNHAAKLLTYEFISNGGLTSTVVDLKLIFKHALQHLASSIVVGHNHPSGTKTPSHSDKNITQRIKQAAAILDIRLLDHIIVANNDYFSFADEGLI